jgi:SAM-dependent methyltransferase
MVERARRLNPGILFQQGDMRSLDVPDEAWAGLVAFYSNIHVPRGEVVPALRELRRTLRPGGLLFLAFHNGTGTMHRDEWWGHPVAIDFLFFTTEEMAGYLRRAAFEIEDVKEREPYPDVEHPSRRAYVLARRPAKDR